MRKTDLLNCLNLTIRKQDLLDSFFSEFLHTLNFTFDYLSKGSSSTELHHLTYSSISNTSFLPSDIVQEARKNVCAKRKSIKDGFEKCSIRLNSRWFRFFETDGGTPCFKITYSPSL